MRRRALRLGVAAAVTAAAATAAAAAAPGPGSAIELTDDRGRVHRFAQLPARIVTLVPSLTETVCELGACDRLVGTDRFSDWPARVAGLPKLGGLEDTPIERVLSLKPDVVLAPGSSRSVERLESLGLVVVTLEPRSFADTQRVIGTVATLLGQPAAGAALWQQMNARIDAAARGVAPGLRGARVYFEVAAAPYAAGEASFVGALLARLGLVNIVPAAMGPFPQINPEFVVRARPQVVMAGETAAAAMPQRPGWGTIPAFGSGGRVCGFPRGRYEFLVRPGPRLAEAAEVMAQCLQSSSPVPPSASMPR